MIVKGRWSVESRLRALSIMIVVSGIFGVIGAIQITKGAKMHELNFKHIKHNHLFWKETLDFAEDKSKGVDGIKEELSLIREQPVECLGMAGWLERSVMSLAGTYQLIIICEQDMVLADETKVTIEAYESGELLKSELTDKLEVAVHGFNRASVEFEPLVDRTVNTVSTFVIAFVITKAFFVGICGLMMAKSVRNDYVALQATEQSLKTAYRQINKSNEELKQFAYVASHDLQEPVRKVISFCNLLKDEYSGQLDEDANTYIDFAVDGATRMRSLVSDLLDYSRVESQGKPLALADAGEACSEAIDILQEFVEKYDVQISVQPLPTILADQGQLVRLFQNLIGNAIKYRSERTPEIQISVEEQGLDWILCVRDNGIGMEPKYYDRIFVMFQRLHARDEYSGTGIGLAICKRIVDRLEGRIWVKSEEGVGSQFFFSVPKLITMPAEGTIGYEPKSPDFTKAD